MSLQDRWVSISYHTLKWPNHQSLYRASQTIRMCLSYIPKQLVSHTHCMYPLPNIRLFFEFLIHLSFSTDDGWYEIARYRWVSNATVPTCITGVVNWVHGLYQLMPNGSIVMTPNGDGYQQIQDPCGAVSNFVENYNLTELYQSWQIFQDPVDGYKLHLFQFDGSPVAPQFQVSVTPIMLPTTKLRNVTAPPAVAGGAGGPQTRKRDLEASGSESRWRIGRTMAVGTILIGAAAGATLFL